MGKDGFGGEKPRAALAEPYLLHLGSGGAHHGIRGKETGEKGGGKPFG